MCPEISVRQRLAAESALIIACGKDNYIQTFLTPSLTYIVPTTSGFITSIYPPVDHLALIFHILAFLSSYIFLFVNIKERS